MNRDQAYQLVRELIKNENLVRHHLAAEAAMKAIYSYLQTQKNLPIDPAEEEKWGMVGLLHDADYELTKDNPEKHTLALEEKIGKDLPEDVMYAIKAHNFVYTKATPKSDMDWAIYACDELTGLIVAATLVHPDRKLASVDEAFVANRFKETRFAKGASREQIKTCEEHLKIPLDNFISIVLKSMQQIAPEIGL